MIDDAAKAPVGLVKNIQGGIFRMGSRFKRFG